ncbi:hypothetical protein TNCT_678081 [Trichonephila clavata]|uniref:Uncharacterized protein n=1 Tax=Trichonephila clavata TaxID=2740835 RepID=A0A8X6J4A5_TRICU|nr:hypothetical protein TNCT_678081 [Trichonephila clavata]
MECCFYSVKYVLLNQVAIKNSAYSPISRNNFRNSVCCAREQSGHDMAIAVLLGYFIVLPDLNRIKT